MSNLYPLKFTSLLFNKIWGGNTIKEWYLPASAAYSNVGESWLISAVEGKETLVANGSLAGKQLSELLSIYGKDLVGQRILAAYGCNFPLLIKFIDAAENLSVQVHPDDDTAWDRHRSLGKTEMWYVMPGSTNEAAIYLGFKEDTDIDELQTALKEQRVLELFSHYSVRPGDVAFIPAGQVHAICKGTIVAEIQENSDLTYRLYDYDRVDDNGKKRDLHLSQAIDVIDYCKPEEPLLSSSKQANTSKVDPTDNLKEYHHDDCKSRNHCNTSDSVGGKELLVQSPYFTTSKLSFVEKQHIELSDFDSFVIYLCIEGEATISAGEQADATISIQQGEAVLIPACIPSIDISPLSQTSQLLVVSC